jgi:Carboxypeptidase regulatory-like domain
MRRRIRLLPLVLPVFLCAAQAQAPLTLSGVVIESGTGKPVPGAAVSAVGGKANPDVTDSEGKFSLTFPPDVKPGTKVRIRVVKDGYETCVRDIAASAEISVPISLKKLLTKSGSPSPPKPLLHQPAFTESSSTASVCLGEGGMCFTTTIERLRQGYVTPYTLYYPKDPNFSVLRIRVEGNT